MKRSWRQTLGIFVKSLIEILSLSEYFTFPYNTSLWTHEVAPGFLTCQLYVLGKGVLFAPKSITDISSQVGSARPLGETGFLLCTVGRIWRAQARAHLKMTQLWKAFQSFPVFLQLSVLSLLHLIHQDKMRRMMYSRRMGEPDPDLHKNNHTPPFVVGDIAKQGGDIWAELTSFVSRKSWSLSLS